MNALVIGYGSIGARHARILTELGCRTAVVSERQVAFPIVHPSLTIALATERPEYVVIANVTSRHYDTLSLLAQSGYAGTVLVEKPLFSEYHDFVPPPLCKVAVGYNLRFHPIIQRLKGLLEGEQVLSVQAYVGQYLPEWRPSADYRASYSASTPQGGGVLRDISHELDYLTWILGGWVRVTALGGHYSDLEINSDDIYSLLVVTSFCPIVSLQMNYLDRVGRRFMLINSAKHTIEVDLIEGTIAIDHDCESFPSERDETYRAMHEDLLSGNADRACSLEEGLETLRLIEAAEIAAKRGEWVAR